MVFYENFHDPGITETVRAVQSGLVLESSRGAVADMTTETWVEDGVSGAPPIYLRVAPKSALSDGWYTLKLGALRGAHVTPRDIHSGLDGGLGVRFRVGSEPTLRSVAVCQKGAAATLTLSMSEAVLIPGGRGIGEVVAVAALDAGARAGSSKCQGFATSPPLDGPNAELSLFCDSIPADFWIEVSADVRGRSGLPLGEVGRPGRGVARALSGRDFKVVGECRVVRFVD